MDIIECKTPIAILLGVYNGEQFLSVQIDSILAQTNKDWTLFIRDDSSNDNTRDIIEQYTKRYDTIVSIKDELGNLGCNGNYFELLRRVKASYYMFCNADDFWFEDKIQLSYNKMKEAEKLFAEKAIVVHTDMSVGDINLNIIVPSHWQAGRYNPEKFKSYNYVGISNLCAGATLLFNDMAKKNCYPEYKGDGLFFDHWLALKNVSCGKIISIFQPTMIHRQIGNNLAGSRTVEERTVKYKLTHMRKLWNLYMIRARELKKIGWGGYLKYFWYKFLVTIKSGSFQII